MASNEKKYGLVPLEKENFIKFISSSSPEEINEFIRTRGKKPKLIVPIIYFK